jgi:putative endonuclease
MNNYYVYILKCSDNSYYTGVTNNLERRVIEHQEGLDKNSYTHNRRPVELVFYTSFTDINQAISFEKQVKGWSRKKKEAIINNNWEKLKPLSECKNSTSHKNYITTKNVILSGVEEDIGNIK